MLHSTVHVLSCVYLICLLSDTTNNTDTIRMVPVYNNSQQTSMNCLLQTLVQQAETLFSVLTLTAMITQMHEQILTATNVL
jgi:hypothetical protein